MSGSLEGEKNEKQKNEKEMGSFECDFRSGCRGHDGM